MHSLTREALSLSLPPTVSLFRACVCVCVKEREKEREIDDRLTIFQPSIKLATAHTKLLLLPLQRSEWYHELLLDGLAGTYPTATKQATKHYPFFTGCFVLLSCHAMNCKYTSTDGRTDGRTQREWKRRDSLQFFSDVRLNVLYARHIATKLAMKKKWEDTDQSIFIVQRYLVRLIDFQSEVLASLRRGICAFNWELNIDCAPLQRREEPFDMSRNHFGVLFPFIYVWFLYIDLLQLLLLFPSPNCKLNRNAKKYSSVKLVGIFTAVGRMKFVSFPSDLLGVKQALRARLAFANLPQQPTIVLAVQISCF